MSHSINGGNDNNSHLPSLFDELEQLNAVQDTNGLLPLDAFLLEGDERTWSMDEWTWDAEHMFAVQKDTLSAHPCCEALKRGHQPIQSMQHIHTPNSLPMHTQTQTHSHGPGPCHTGHNHSPQMHLPAQSHGPAPCHAGHNHSQNMYNSCAASNGHNIAQGHPACHHAASTINGMAVFEKSHTADTSAKPAWMQADNSGFHPSLADLYSAPTVLPIMMQRPPVSQQDPHAPHALNCPPVSSQIPSDYAMQSTSQHMSAPIRALSPFEEPFPSDLQPLPQSQSLMNLEDVLEVALPGNVPVLQGPPPEGANALVCQVLGCSNDLIDLKEYHHKYHICDVHIRLPQVMKEGRLQRFCQQCGRFHDLVAFDNNRKSCREQLSKHNARRRMRTKIERVKGRVAPAVSLKSIAECPSVAVSCAGPAPAPQSSILGGYNSGSLSGFGNSDPVATAVMGCSILPACETPAPPAPAAAAGVVPASNHNSNANCSKVKDSASVEGDVGQLLTALMQQPAQLNALRLLLGVQTNAALPVMRPFRPESNGEVDVGGAEPSSYSVAREILDGKGSFNPRQYSSEHASLRVSMKLFGRTPADLPQDMKQQVTSWLSAAPVAMEGLIRPGCVFVTMQLVLDLDTYRTAIARGVQGLVDHLLYSTKCMFWRTGVYTVQVDKDLASLTNGQVTGFFSACPRQLMQLPAGQAGIVPQLEALSPICVVASSKHTPSPISVKLQGSQLDTAGLGVMCRHRGLQLKGQLTPSVATGGAGSGSGATAHLPHFTTCGLALVELSRNAFLTDALPLLVVDNPAIAAEVCSLEKMGLPALVATSFTKTAEGSIQLQQKLNRVLAFACDHGLVAVVKVLLHSASSPVSSGDSLSLLHRADQSGPLGITPLHLAALAPNVKLALALLNPECCLKQEEAFSQLVADDGVTPFHLALQMGNFGLSTLVKALSWSQVASAQEGKATLTPHSRAHKHAGEVDPCQVCHSSVPPLVLSIAASCFTCGMERACLSEDELNNDVGELCCSSDATPHAAADPTDKCSASSSWAGPGGTDHSNNMGAGASGHGPDMDRMPSRSKCGHDEKDTLYRIKALCQTCHVDRRLEAA
eukprot:gene13229-19070_t